MTDPISLPTIELLMWIASPPRSYAETIEAWRSTCPRLSVWEDALADGLVAVENGRSPRVLHVTLTARGEAALGGAASSG